jgi:hypothetical protein
MAAAHAKDTGADGEEGCHDILTTGGDDAWPFAGTAAAADTSGSNAAAAGGVAAAGSGRVGMYGCSSQIGVLKFQHRCQAGSGVVVHVRAPAVSGFASREELVEIVQAAVAAATAAATAEAPTTDSSSGSSSWQQQQQQQVALLLQCRLHCCFQGLPQHAGSSHHSGHGRHSYHAQHIHSSSNSSHARPLQQQQHKQAGSAGGSQPFAAAPAFEVLVDDITLFRVSNLGGRRAASAACVCMQGLQVYTGGSSSSSTSNRLCALLLPKHSKTLGPPGVEVLQVNPGGPNPPSNSASSTQGSSRATSSSRRSKATAATAAAPAPMPGVLSVLLRGATLSLDAGGLSLDWAAQLADFVAPLAAAAAAGAAAAAAPVASPPVAAPAVAGPQQQQQALVVNLQDFALRFEPRCDVPGSHNSSRMAAALVLDGAHWQLNPGPAAPQQVLLHSLGFYVAAAAARSGGCSSSSAAAMGAGSGSKGSKASSSGRGGLAAWDAAAPVDLHGMSLSSAGYNCLAQEGGLAVLLRPAAAGAPAAGGAASTGTL